MLAATSGGRMGEFATVSAGLSARRSATRSAMARRNPRDDAGGARRGRLMRTVVNSNRDDASPFHKILGSAIANGPNNTHTNSTKRRSGA